MAVTSQPRCFLSDGVLEFYEETGNSDLIEEAKRDQALWHDLLEQCQDTGLLGLVLGNSSDNQWAFISKEPEVQGKADQYRFTVFDRRGFVYHSCFDQLEQAVIDAFDDGFKHVCPDDTLDRISREWAFEAYSPSA